MRRGALAAAGALLLACAPGYLVRLEATGVGPAERDRALVDLEMEARAEGFEPLGRRRERGALPGAASFVKPLSPAEGDYVSLDVFHSAADRTLRVEIAHARRGREGTVRAGIDALADACRARLATRAGRERVSFRRERTRPASLP